MSAPPDTPHTRALDYQKMLIDFLCTPMMQRAESPAPAWLLTPEGQQYIRHWSRGDYNGAFRIFDEASAHNFRVLMNTAFDDVIHPPTEENAHG
jgi:hypothetical protein